MSKISISMAIDDFYAKQTNFYTNVVLHMKDSKEDVVGVAFSDSLGVDTESRAQDPNNNP
ncbi:hypothetical protein QJS10_CPA06g02166 [Acorus calamus]|uniref:Uncharacterized protein n=1 Tax=Acorus calamus TaxID=4465 RepID=A0AAV9EQZ5_ACOCL|nr:hypothetical protein QJS10_CPA06g02166 [Acorus calamus]